MTVENSEKKSNRIGTIVCLLFVLIGIILIGMSAYYSVAYDKVEGEVEVRESEISDSDGDIYISTFITYEYEDVLYEEIGMRSYNAFTMKDGENCTVYINPNKPDCPKTTNYALGIIFFVAGSVVFVVTQKDNKKNRKEML